MRSAYKIGGVSVEMGTLDFGRSRNCIKVRMDRELIYKKKKKKKKKKGGFGIFGFCDEKERERE